MSLRRSDDRVLDNGETVVVTLGTPTTTVGVVRRRFPESGDGEYRRQRNGDRVRETLRAVEEGESD